MVEPYLTFNGNANEAIDFYETIFDGTNKKLLRFCDMPANPEYPILEHMKNWIGHGEMTICGTHFCFGDQQEKYAPSNFTSLMVHLESPEAVQCIYDALRKEGKVLM
jgi:PhnB protein